MKNTICYRILFLSSTLVLSPVLLATKDQEKSCQPYLSQIKEYFLPKDSAAPSFLKNFVHEQAEICGVDPKILDVRVSSDSDELWKCKARFYPILLTPGNKACILVNRGLAYKIGISSLLKNISSSADSLYGVNVINARHQLGRAQQESKFGDFAHVGLHCYVLTELFYKALLKHIPKHMQTLGLVPATAALALTALCEKNIGEPLYYKYREASADNFAIAHSSEKNYLLAAAQFFEHRHQLKLEKLKKEAESSATQKALLELAQRYPLLFELYYWDDTHPSDLSRAKKFSTAAAQIEDSVKTVRENQSSYPVENEYC